MSALRLLLLSLAAPALAAPAEGQVFPVRLDTTDAIPYRALKQRDFQGEHPPKPFLGRADLPRPVAVTCAYVTADPRARVFAEPVGYSRRRYRPRVEGLSFRAMFSRSCSWWNRDHDLSPVYVLEHEQIHFALFEAAARRLNRDVPRMLASAALEADSPDSVVALARRHIQDALRRSITETSQLNLEFDRATSGGFSPARQEGWRRRVEKDLEELARFAADPPPGRRAPVRFEDFAAPSSGRPSEGAGE